MTLHSHWWERLKVSVSTAEELLFIELQRRGLTDHLTTQKGYYFDKEKDGVGGTRVDFDWDLSTAYSVFLDGPLHLKRRQSEKDELITQALQRRGHIVDRFFFYRLTQQRLKEIADQIEKRIKELS